MLRPITRNFFPVGLFIRSTLGAKVISVLINSIIGKLDRRVLR
jgi:hypothetical protein